MTSASPALPEETEIVVIGGGVAGIGAALALAEAGVPVVVCEKGRIAGEQSSRNWGWIRRQGRDLRELPLMMESQALWRRYAGEVGEPIGYREPGVAYLALSEREMAEHEAWVRDAAPYEPGTRLIGAAETASLLGQNDEQFVGGMITDRDARAEPRLAVPALARLARRKGALIAEATAVRGIEQGGGRITAVHTEHGRIRCRAAILAGGIWSRPFLENIGLSLPQLAVRASVLRTSEAPLITETAVGTSRAAIRRRDDGGYTIARSNAATFDIIPAAFAHLRAYLPLLMERWKILKLRAGPSFFGPLGRHRWEVDEPSPFEAVRVMDPEPDHGLLDKTFENAKALFPQLRGSRIVERWAGLIDVMPDEVPVIGEAPGVAGLVIATGLSGHGFGFGPGAGRLAADLAIGRTPIVDPAAFARSRFS